MRQLPTETHERLAQVSPVSRFSQIEGGSEFNEEIDRMWEGLEQVKETVKSQVAKGNFSPVLGIAIIACSTGQTFGYQEFHGYPSASDTVLKSLPVEALGRGLN